jgi:hypothetical protein
MAVEKWKEGESGNPNGRPPGKATKPISPLRKTLNKLRDMEEKSLENIRKAVEGTDLDKQQLETSKWVISTVASLTRAATQDEELRLKIKQGNAPEQEEAPKVQTEQSVDGKVLTMRPRVSTDIQEYDFEE